MAIEQVKVHEVVQQAVNKSIDIPEFQRDFVWEPEQVKKLVESLYRGYPIGSFLLWDSSVYEEARTAQGSRASLWIVDGQQRTTALCLLLGRKPYWWSEAESWNKALERYDVMVNLLPDEGEDLDFALSNPVRRKDPRWVSIRKILEQEDIGGLTKLAQEIAEGIVDDPNKRMELVGKILPRLTKLWQIRELDIPVIKIYHEAEDVAEIFARLNQEGTRVKEADVVLALAAIRNPGWVRKEYLPFRKDLEDSGWDLDAGIFVRTMTGIGKGRARLKEVPKDFWSPDNLDRAWKATKETIEEVLKRLAEYGIMSLDLLPSANSLIPLFVLHRRWKDREDYHFGKALRWFLLANRDGRYSGSAIVSLNEDVRAITEARDFNQAIENLLKRLRISLEFTEEDFLTRYERDRFLRLMLYLVLFKREARDWVDKTRIGYDKTGARISAGFEPQWHHIYPRSILRKAGFQDEKIHALANITVLNERTNVGKLANKEPWRYIQQFSISESDLRSHLIPEPWITGERQWDVKQYEEFLSERARLLAEEANEFLKSLES